MVALSRRSLQGLSVALSLMDLVKSYYISSPYCDSGISHLAASLPVIDLPHGSFI